MTWNSDAGRPVLLSTTDFIAGREIESNLGLVVGSEKLGSGGTSNVEEKTQDAVNRLIKAALAIGADAVIGLRIDSIRPTSDGADRHMSMLAYGTAVKLR